MMITPSMMMVTGRLRIIESAAGFTNDDAGISDGYVFSPGLSATGGEALLGFNGCRGFYDGGLSAANPTDIYAAIGGSISAPNDPNGSTLSPVFGTDADEMAAIAGAFLAGPLSSPNFVHKVVGTNREPREGAWTMFRLRGLRDGVVDSDSQSSSSTDTVSVTVDTSPGGIVFAALQSTDTAGPVEWTNATAFNDQLMTGSRQAVAIAELTDGSPLTITAGVTGYANDAIALVAISVR